MPIGAHGGARIPVQTGNPATVLSPQVAHELPVVLEDHPLRGPAHLRHPARVLTCRQRQAEADTGMITAQSVDRASCRLRRNTRRWCGGKVGRPHEFVLRKTLGLDFGLPPLHVWACSRCGRKAYNLKVSRRHAVVAVSRAAV
ncbi:MAG: hypothetical protein ACHQ9S_03635 [Candidatus Binatia bacterium]